MLVLALVAVALYLAELRGLWAEAGLRAVYGPLSLAIDLVFVADLLLKSFALGRGYLRSPWFLIDLLSSLPVLGSLAALPGPLQGLRFVRALRFFRILRTLRLVRVLEIFRGAAETAGDTPEGRAFHRALFAAVLVYTGLFVAVVALADGDPWAEFHVVLGSALGMLLVLVVTRFQVRDLSSQQMRDLLNIALPVQVAEHFMAHPEHYHRTVHMPATIIFCDLAGFTKTVEGLRGDLDALKQHLEAALDAVVEVHREQDLIVDKFIGDAVMSFRGGDLVKGTPAEHAGRCVRASLDGARALAEAADPYFHAMKIGGASSDDAVIGTFGTSTRLSYTVLGDDVNLASRLEAACGQIGAANVFCARTHELTRDRADIAWRRLGAFRVKGKAAPQPVLEALDASGDPPGEWLQRFEVGLERYEAADFELAGEAFEAADRLREGGDGPSRFYAARCRELREVGVPAGWEPALTMTK